MAKVMLVEDDNNLREIYEARLQAEGYDIVTAHDGEEALVLAKAEKPDLIISDVMMPKISGFEMLDILRNTDGMKDVKVIMLTALGQADDQQRADRLGADSYLVKSQVTLEDIVKVADRLLNGEPTPEPVADVPIAPVAEPVVQAPVAPLAPMPEPMASTLAVPAPEPVSEPIVVTAPVIVPELAIVPQPVVTTAPVFVTEPTMAIAPEPTPAVITEPVSVPILPTPTAMPAPVPPTPLAAPDGETDFMQSIGASTQATAQPAAYEAATVEAQIADFVNATGAAPAEVELSELPATAEPPAPTEQFVATNPSDLNSAVNAPAPSPQSAGNDDVLATALESLTGEAPAPAPDLAQPSTAPQADPTAARGGGRVIAPLDTAGMPAKPDLNTLLALEEAKEKASQGFVPPTLPVDMPTPVVESVDPPAPMPMQAQPQTMATPPAFAPAPVSPLVINPVTPPAAPGFDPNNIAL